MIWVIVAALVVGATAKTIDLDSYNGPRDFWVVTAVSFCVAVLIALASSFIITRSAIERDVLQETQTIYNQPDGSMYVPVPVDGAYRPFVVLEDGTYRQLTFGEDDTSSTAEVTVTYSDAVAFSVLQRYANEPAEDVSWLAPAFGWPWVCHYDNTAAGICTENISYKIVLPSPE